MTENQALSFLENMPEKQFQEFFKWLPARVQIILKANFVNWRECLPEWYSKYIREKDGEVR